MRVAFVGVKRRYRDLDPSYVDDFNRFHLELPYYFARDGRNDVTITTVDHSDGGGFVFPSTFGDDRRIGRLNCTTEGAFVDDTTTSYDVVVHWRRWFPEFYRPEAVNVINCQDHSFSAEWLGTVHSAATAGRLWGILCFPGWHESNLRQELAAPSIRTISGLTLGVDTEIYTPHPEKDPRRLLWASDPGRGLQSAVELAGRLHHLDRRYHLDVCHPDYASCRPGSEQAVTFVGNIRNGPDLWNMFNRAGVLPYTSTFMEPSSRAHRQAMAAGCLVLYPPDRGTPSEQIVDGVTGFVRPVETWATTILRTVTSSDEYGRITAAARMFAVSENWAVQAKRFNGYFEGVLGGHQR